MLTAEECSWLQEQAEDTLGLTRPRVRILIAVLERERFSLREIGRASRQTSEGVRLALDTLAARGLIEFYAVGPAKGRNAAYHARPGSRLRLLLDRLVQPVSGEASVEPAPPAPILDESSHKSS